MKKKTLKKAAITASTNSNSFPTAHIGDAQITDAKIGSLPVNH